MSRGADQAGWTLVELLIATTLMLLILGATLGTFERFIANESLQQKQNDSQDAGRSAIDLLSKRLRNLASPRPPGVQSATLERATPTDLIFRTVSRNGPNSGQNVGNVYRVRYCQSTAQPNYLMFQSQSWTSAVPPAVPADTACPGAGWDAGTTIVAARDVRNSTTPTPRPIFSYGMTDGTSFTTVPSTRLAEVIAIRPDLFTDVNPGKPPVEVETKTSVFLRNQNRPPTANISVTVTGQTVTLNAAGSVDPEEQLLTFYWKDGSTDLIQGPGPMVLKLANVPRGSTHTYTLTVTDPDGLSDTDSQTVTIP